MHNQASPLVGQEVEIKSGDLAGSTYRVGDYWDRVVGKSWMMCVGNPACMNYALRTSLQNFQVPTDDEVLYGKIGAFGYLVHVTEL